MALLFTSANVPCDLFASNVEIEEHKDGLSLRHSASHKCVFALIDSWVFE